MRKIFLATIFALMFTVQNFCGAAATVDEVIFNGNEKLKYPIVHTGNSAVDKKINRVLDGITQNFVMEVNTDRREHGINITVENSGFQIMCNGAKNSNVLSMILYQSKYGSNGPAHPTNYSHALNFDLSTGERLKTSDLAKFGYGDSNSLFQKLSLKLKDYVAARNIKNMSEPKSLPENFYFDEDFHLHFLFEQNSIAHYAYGTIDIDMDK